MEQYRMEQVIAYRYNITEVTSMEDFANIRGRVSKSSKDVYFVRLLGANVDFENQLHRMDAILSRRMQEGRLFYQRVHVLPALSVSEDILFYTQCYHRWLDHPDDGVCTKVSHGALAVQLGAACKQVVERYLEAKAAVTESMRKNFAVKMLYWFDYVCAGWRQWSVDSCMKITADNVTKEQEYLFYYLLTQIGCDVLLLQTEGDLKNHPLKHLSKEIRMGEFRTLDIPAYEPTNSMHLHGTADTAKAVLKETGNVVVKIPQRVRKKHACSASNTAGFSVQDQRQKSQQQAEKSFEELATLASSIVLILVHDPNGDVIATGSGIMVGKSGYILTNDHVVRGGASYSVRIENDDKVYQTDELIKYHSVLDLALLRIPRRLQPLPIYQGRKKLVRGQAVAAIGSPLGLFNSISDGIISGFRTIDGVDMIQFTAPISHGSSGGAVLNMYGEVIGISAAGFDRGQNINLAVGYESINLFIQGFRS